MVPGGSQTLVNSKIVCSSENCTHGLLCCCAAVQVPSFSLGS